MLHVNEYSLLKERKFFYLEVFDKVQQRNDIIDHILEDKDPIPRYLESKQFISITTDHRKAVFKKESRHFNFTRKLFKDVPNFDYKIKHISAKDFLKLMKDAHETEYPNNAEYLRNIRKSFKEAKIQEKIKELRSNYKCISAYEMPRDFRDWLECPNCGLKPMVWEFNNGRSTACGCGESEYKHFSIQAESVMSAVKRNGGSAEYYNTHDLKNNWNHWVTTGEVLFDREKELENGIW